MKAIDRFIATSRFIAAFRYRNRLSLRRPSFKRRPKATQDDIDQFIAEVQVLLDEYHRNRIINIDETNWKTVPGAFMTWVKKGAESVQCQIANDDKEGVTLIAAIDANGGKLS
jgi:hypothetical protein